MKNKLLLIFFGALLTLTGGFFWFAHWIFVSFEHREDYNGVGWSAFAQSVRKHVDDGPHMISDFGHYEGSVNFTVTDDRENAYKVWTSRSSYLDARDMQTLKHSFLNIIKIGGQNLVCQNNFDEKVYAVINRENSLVLNQTSMSLNDVVKAYKPLAGIFGESLPTTYSISEGKVADVPDWLSIDAERGSSCCNNAIKPPKPVTSILCRLNE